MADYAELQAALLERLDIIGDLSSGGSLIFGAQINYISFDSESGAVSVLVRGPYDKLKKNRGYLYGGTSPVTSSLRLFDAAAKNRPLLRLELRSLNSLLEHLEGGEARYSVYNMGNAIKNIWLDPDAEIEGARDMPWITGMPHGEKLSGMRSDAPYNWPDDMTALGANSSPVSPSAWLRTLGISERPMHQLHTPDNKVWFDYAKAFAASLKKLAIPFNKGQSLQTYRTGSGSSQDSSDPAH